MLKGLRAHSTPRPPQFIAWCSACNLQHIKAKIEFVSALLCDSSRGDAGVFDVAEKRRKHLFEPHAVGAYVTVGDSLVHQCGRSPTAQQIDTPDLCLWRPLICLLRLTIIPPLPTCADRWRLRWGVLDLHCMVGWRGTGLDQIRPCSLCAYVFLGAGKSYR